MGIPIPVEATLDEKTATAAADKAVRVFDTAGKKAGEAFSGNYASGMREAEQDTKRFADRASDAMDKVRDSTGRLRAEEEKLKQVRQSGNDAQIIAQAERVEKARRAEVRAIRDATDAYGEYERAAESAGRQGGESVTTGLRGAISGASSSGRDMAEEFVSGFAGASGLTRLGASGGPIGLAVAGAAALGLAAGKTLAENIDQGLQTLQQRDLIGARLGISDPAVLARYGEAAGKAYADGWGTSIEDNLTAIQFGVQGGLVKPDASQDDLQQLIGQSQNLAGLMDESVASIARGSRNFIRTGLVDTYEQAFDLLTAAQAKGLNLSEDLLDTAEEYGTAWKGVGLSGADALGLIQQMLQGGIRNSDVAADSLKELAINANDGSKSTKQAFEALGLDADQTAQRLAAGGPAARAAFGDILSGLRDLDDPIQQKNVGLALFKTKWEDAAVAIKAADLPTAAQQLGDVEGASRKAASQVSEHASGWDLLGRNMDNTFSKLKVWLADSTIGKFIGQGLPGALNQVFNNDPAAQAQAKYQDALKQAATNDMNAQLKQAQDRAQAQLAGDTSRITPVPMPSATDPAAGKPSFDPSQYSLDAVPLGSFPGSPAGGAPAGAPAAPGTPNQVSGLMWGTGGDPYAKPGYGYYEVDQQKIFDAETSVMSQRNSVEQARVRVLELEASGTATQQEKNAARNAEVLAERAYQSTLTKLAEAQQGTWKKMESTANSMANGMDTIGAKLDDDFGLSKGLPGIAENLTKFIGNMIAAPELAKLNAISEAAGDEGHGLVGILGAKAGWGQPGKPGGPGGPLDFNPQASGGAPGAPGYAPSAGYAVPQALPAPVGTYGLPAGVNSGGYGGGGTDFPNWVKQLGAYFQVSPSTYPGHQESDRNEPGYAPNPQHENRGIDWTGSTDNLQKFADYLSTIPQDLEQVIWQNPVTGAKTGIGGGQINPGYYDQGTYDEHGGNDPSNIHVHTRTSAPIPLPYSSGGGGGGAPAFGPGGPPMSSPFGQQTPLVPNGALFGGGGTGAAPGPDAGGVAYPAHGGGGSAGGGGGLLGAVTSAAASSVPGAGAAAQIGVQEISRAVQFAGQAASIGVGGLMETFLPSGSSLGSAGNSWFGRIAGAIGGGKPALPNMAGKSPAPANPGGGSTHNGDSVGGDKIGEMHNSSTTNVTVNGVTDAQALNMYAANAPSGPRQ